MLTTTELVDAWDMLNQITAPWIRTAVRQWRAHFPEAPTGAFATVVLGGLVEGVPTLVAVNLADDEATEWTQAGTQLAMQAAGGRVHVAAFGAVPEGVRVRTTGGNILSRTGQPHGVVLPSAAIDDDGLLRFAMDLTQLGIDNEPTIARPPWWRATGLPLLAGRPRLAARSLTR